ncbi:MAG: hypothetical protein R2838_00225 [Caldilineaceae bacterium]
MTSMAIDFGPVAALDYDGNNEPDQVFVITKGGLGDVALPRPSRRGHHHLPSASRSARA